MVHWLQYGGMRCRIEREKKQLEELRRYLRENPAAKADGYFKNTGDVFARVVRLECNQSYADLDMDCNSLSSQSLKRMAHKPADIEFSAYITQKINDGLFPVQAAEKPSILKTVEENKSIIANTDRPDKTAKPGKDRNGIE